MDALVVFDSVAGNTEKIAQAIAAGIGAGTKAVRPNSPDAKHCERLSLLVVGSPTYGGRPTETMQKYLDTLSSLPKALKIAAFDTRLKMKFARLFGFAADKMEVFFREKGIGTKGRPEGFIVKGRNGPLAEGELERANAWGKSLRLE
ncbi:MAG TPA: flavodoxin domain-containing protein [Spirochaetia bacterium]|nr:flavodoxin domain-containing protein [Spirochaetia bacterium]